MKTCQRCNSSFQCSTEDQKCWCMQLPVVNNTPEVYKDCLCPNCLNYFACKSKTEEVTTNLKEGEDFYYEKGLTVFTEKYHKKKGFCCGNGCRHCPY